MNFRLLLLNIGHGLSTGMSSAIVAASLSALTEPLLNRVLVLREPISTAVRSFSPKSAATFFKTAVSTNLMKFPLYEILHETLSVVNVPPFLRGAFTGACFTSLTLPLTNYRFYRSMNWERPNTPGYLFEAYLPTVLRDIVYGISRNVINSFLTKKFPNISPNARVCMHPSSHLFLAERGSVDD
jgi:hypothetical protein